VQVTAVPRGDTTRRPSVAADTLLEIGAAVRRHEVLRFDYAGGSTPPVGNGPTAVRPPRRTEPHHLVTWGGKWYLVGYDLDRVDWRTFRVDRMRPKSPTGPRFTPRELPAPDVATYVSTQFKTLSTWAVRGEAVLRLPAGPVARWAGRDALVETVDEESCRVVMGAWSWDGLAARLGMFGADLQVVGPPELRAATLRLAERFAAAAS
jgi:predicted DNA-binding transcriptional regulator YafY